MVQCTSCLQIPKAIWKIWGEITSERPKLKLAGLHSVWKCTTFTWADPRPCQRWEQCTLQQPKEPVFLLKRPHLPHGLGIRGPKLQELTHLPGMITLSPHQNASAVLVAILPSQPLQPPFACSFGLLVSKLNPSLLCLWHVGSKPGHCTQTERRERDCACSRMGFQGAASRSQGDSTIQHGNAAAWVYQQPAAKSLLLLFIFK